MKEEQLDSLTSVMNKLSSLMDGIDVDNTEVFRSSFYVAAFAESVISDIAALYKNRKKVINGIDRLNESKRRLIERMADFVESQKTAPETVEA